MSETPAPSAAAPRSRGRAGLRQFWRDLPAEGRWALSTTAFQTIGRGMTLPFTVIYLNEVRAVPLSTAGILLGVVGVVALLVTAPAGALADRWGARRLLIIGTVAAVLGPAVLGVGTTIGAFVAGFVLLGISFGVSWSSWNTLVGPPGSMAEQCSFLTGALRQQFYGVNFALINLGIGIGGVVSGLVADVERPSTFTLIFLIDAACMLIPLALLLGPLRHLDGRPDHPAADPSAASYRAVLRQPTVLWLTTLTFILTLVGYGQLEAGFQAWSRQVSEVSTRTIGFAFAVNTAVIVALQFVVMARIAQRRRTRVLASVSVIWALAWLLLGATGLVPGTAAAAVGVMGFTAVFGFGEIMMQSTIPALVNDLADDHSRGRANAVNAGAFQLGAILGPIVAGVLLQHHLDVEFLVVMVAGCGLVAVSALALERRLPAEINRVGEAPSVGEAPDGSPDAVLGQATSGNLADSSGLADQAVAGDEVSRG